MNKLIISHSVIWMLVLVVMASLARGADPLLYGIMANDGTCYASLKLDNKPTEWLREGEYINGYAVVKIDPKAHCVNLLTRGGAALRVSLTKADVLSDPGVPDAGVLIPLTKLNWAWIKSDANPMRKERMLLPDWAARNWRTLNGNTKLALKNYYRSHGWDIQVTPQGKSGLSVTNIRLKDPSEPPPSAEELKKRFDTRVKVNSLGNPITKDTAHEK